jgi:hypothetical protein
MTMPRDGVVKYKDLQFFSIPNKTMSTINYKEGKCEKCGRQPVTIGIPVLKTPQLKEHQVLIRKFGVLTVLGNYFTV